MTQDIKDTSDVGRRLLKQATDAATEAVEKCTTLRGVSARRVAQEALNAGGDHLRAEHAGRLSGIDRQEAVAWAAVSVGVLALDLVVLTAMAVKGPGWIRGMAAAAVAGHVGVWAVARRWKSRTAAAARAGLESPV